MSELECCEVNERGIDHRFVHLDFGARCACGRTVFVYDLKDEAWSLRRSSPPDDHPRRIVGLERVIDVRATMELLLTRGAQVIREARQLRVRAAGTTRRLAQGADNAGTVCARGRSLCEQARQLRRLARAQRGARSGARSAR